MAREGKQEQQEAPGTRKQQGHAAEGVAARYLASRGVIIVARNVHSRGGEIDLIVSEGERIVFVEVKKSRTHAEAAQRITARQMGRIMRSAEAYLGLCPCGALTDARVDVALVDAQGAIEIVPNAGMMI